MSDEHRNRVEKLNADIVEICMKAVTTIVIAQAQARADDHQFMKLFDEAMFRDAKKNMSGGVLPKSQEGIGGA